MNGNDALRKDLTSQEFKLFRDWIHQHSGIFLEDIKIDSLRISLVTRATRLGFSEYTDYFEMLTSDDGEFKELMNLVTINETSFFRFPGQFEALKSRVIPEILQGKAPGDRQFRAWSAGCSTGEEPYTIAMALLDSSLDPLGYSIEVMGSDVSTQALEKARRGMYPERAVANLSADVVRRWFEPVEGGYRPVKRVRDLCSFQYHNLIKEPYPLSYMSGWDLIFCRNVTIYFRLESTKRVVEHFYEALNPGGYLFIGHSETLSSVSDQFEAVEVDGVFLYRKPDVQKATRFSEVVAKSRREKPAATNRAAAGEARPSVLERLRKPRPVERAPRPLPVPDEAPDASAAELVARAHERLERSDTAGALALALSALEIDPNDIDAHIVAAFAHADAGDFQSARLQAEEALRRSPLAAPARYILGVINREAGDKDGAVAEFKRTLYLDRDFVLAHFALANIYKQRGECDIAKREYENTMSALKANPEGKWTAFLGGFTTDLLMLTCQRGLVECGKGRTRN